MADNNNNMIPEEDRLGNVMPRYLAGYVDTISQAVQRIGGSLTSGLAQFPNIISTAPLQVVGHFAGQFPSGPGSLGLGFSDIFSSGAQLFGQVANELTSGQQLQVANNNSVLQLQVFGQVASELTSGLQLQVANSNSVLHLQIVPNDDHVIQMPPDQESANTDHPTQLLAREIWKISIPTMVFAISTALYKPASGVLFRHHPLPYYSALGTIFLAGVGEALTAYWLSCFGDANGRRFNVGRAVWWASVVPLILVLGIGGCHIIVGY